MSQGKNKIGHVLIHESSKISETAVLGPNVVIGENCVIGDGVRLSNTSIFKGAKVGDFCSI